MKRSKKLIICLLVLTLVSLGAFGATKLFSDTAEESGETEEVVSVFTLGTDSITSLSLTYNGETASFKLTDDNWSYPDDEAFPVDTDKISTILNALSEVSSIKTISSTEELSAYGLDEPIISITINDGEEKTLLIGSESAMGDGIYAKSGDGIYIIDSSLADTLSLSLADFIDFEELPDVDSVTTAALKTETETLNYVYKEDSGLSYSDDFVWFYKSGENYKALDTSLTNTFMSTVASPEFNSCVTYNASTEELTEYGFDTPRLQVNIAANTTVSVDSGETDSDGTAIYTQESQSATYSYELGNDTDEGCYIRLTGSKMVYILDSDTADTLLNTTVADLLPTSVLSLDFDTVTDIDVTIDGNSFSLTKETVTVDSATEDDEDTEDEDTSETTTTDKWMMDDTEVDFESAISLLESLESAGDAVGADLTGNEEISFVFHTESENHPEIKLSLLHMNASYCVAVINGEATVLTGRSEVVELAEAVNELISTPAE